MSQSALQGGMRTFSIVWFGQLVSTLGSGLTGFALGVWVFQETGSVTLFALNLLAYAVPNLLVSPLAGALVDRWDRRRVMIMSDTGAGLSTLAIALLWMAGSLEVWHIYLATVVNSTFSAFQWPAYSAATSLLVPKRHLGRAGGMVQIGEAISQLISPAVAGALFVTSGLQAIVLIDFATYLFAILTLSFIRFPQPKETVEGASGKGALLKEAGYGWRYILARPGLLGLLGVFAATNFLTGMMSPLLPPLLLKMTSPDMMGYLSSIVGVGMLLGTVLMSAWGGPQRRVHGVLGYMAIGGLFISLLGMRPSLPLMAVGGFGMMFVMPIINGSSQAIWQSKVAADVQGRVFAVRRMIAWSMIPLAYILAGPLADRVFEPLLLADGPLASSLGVLMGVGPGRGTGLLIVIMGLLSALVAIGGYLNPRVRLVEDELPDAIPDLHTEAIDERHGETPQVLSTAE
ncbi:MAG TPA: MFS transporter [Anaerolineales bacterium]|nr:MFS transporter [Anaerolineales bacterium]